jgi:hypothetical protein
MKSNGKELEKSINGKHLKLYYPSLSKDKKLA